MGIIIGILILRPLKGGGSINHGSTLVGLRASYHNNTRFGQGLGGGHFDFEILKGKFGDPK